MSERTAPVESDTPFRYTAELADSIETAWQDRWEAEGTFNADNPVGALAGPGADKEKFFLLDMFPYPSGKGLHVGHPLGYISTDVVARFNRMTGKNVLYTMGYDAFGLPAEQYAVTTGQHPRISTEANIANMRRQLRRLGLSHDPRRSLATIDVDYVRWTQWIFLQVFNSWFDPEAPRRDGRGKGAARPVTELRDKLASGQVLVPDGRDWDALSAAEQAEVIDSFRLAYVSNAPVNWCPGLGTVLANEEVTAEGRSERGNYPVFKRNLRQWMMRITAYADRLAEDLDTVDWPEKVKLMQRNWIGRSEGAEVTFAVEGAQKAGCAVADLDICEVFILDSDSEFLVVGSIWDNELAADDPALMAYIDRHNSTMYAPRAMLGSEGDATVLLADMAAFTGEGMSDAQLHGFLSSAFTTLLGFYETAEERLSALVIRREGDY